MMTPAEVTHQKNETERIQFLSILDTLMREIREKYTDEATPLTIFIETATFEKKVMEELIKYFALYGWYVEIVGLNQTPDGFNHEFRVSAIVRAETDFVEVPATRNFQIDFGANTPSAARQPVDEDLNENPPIPYLIEKDWLAFQKIGLLWWTNRILHLFGWAIVYEFRQNKLRFVYPKRVTYRGFDHGDEEEGFKALTGYLEKNSGMLNDEVNRD